MYILHICSCIIAFFSVFFLIFFLFLRVYLCIHVRTCDSFEVSTLIAACHGCPACSTKFSVQKSERKKKHSRLDLFCVWLSMVDFYRNLTVCYSINLIHPSSIHSLFVKKFLQIKTRILNQKKTHTRIQWKSVVIFLYVTFLLKFGARYLCMYMRACAVHDASTHW